MKIVTNKFRVIIEDLKNKWDEIEGAYDFCCYLGMFFLCTCLSVLATAVLIGGIILVLILLTSMFAVLGGIIDDLGTAIGSAVSYFC